MPRDLRQIEYDYDNMRHETPTYEALPRFIKTLTRTGKEIMAFEPLTKEDDSYPDYFSAALTNDDDSERTPILLNRHIHQIIVCEARAVIRHAIDNGEVGYDNLYELARSATGHELYNTETGMFRESQDFINDDMLNDEESNIIIDALKAEGVEDDRD